MGALLDFDDGPNYVAFFAPELEETAAMRLSDGVACKAHIEEDATVLEQGGSGVGDQIVFEGFG